MTALAMRMPVASAATRGTSAWTAALLLLAAFLIRLPHFGDPAVSLDEQFYLLVGDRMLHGALPYVDIWDRKPVGLFLIYAAIRLLGGEGIYAYQIVATLFAGATACVIARIAARGGWSMGSVFAGLAYLLWIETVDGGGGQSPVFYNLPMALAAGATFAALETGDRARFRTLGIAAMALVGLAIQIKYTVLFEGLYFGLLLAWRSRRHERSLLAAVALTAALALVALLPTLAAIAVYMVKGQLGAFCYANFVSIFHRAPLPLPELHHRLVQALVQALPLSLCGAASLYHVGRNGSAAQRRWLWLASGWLIAATIGFFSVGTLFFHYLLPVFVPLCIVAAPIFAQRPVGLFVALAMLWLPLSHLDYPDFATTARSQDDLARLRRLIPAEVRDGCMQMLAGPPMLYHLTGACFVSRYVFPDHLRAQQEMGAIGTDRLAEVERIMARRPLVLVTDDTLPATDRSRAPGLRAERDRAYALAGRVAITGETLDIWVRR